MRRTRLSLRRRERSECRSGDSRVRAVVGSCRAGEVVGEGLSRGAPAKRLSWSAVECVGDRGELLGRVPGEVGASGEVLAKEPVGVLVGAALPRALRIAEVDLQARVDPSLACSAISAPWSQVSDRRSCSGSVVIAAAIASRTCSPPCPVTGGPFLTGGCRGSGGGRCSSIVKRVERSTSVPIAEWPVPRIRSPSQCPGTARSCASAGRSLIMISSLTKFLPRCERALGTRSARPVRKHATISRLSAPRLWT